MTKTKKISTEKMIGYLLLVAVVVVAFFVVPNKSVTSKYMMKVINEGLIYFIAVLGLSVVLGLGGQVTFSTAGIMGIGSYVCAIFTTRYGWDPLAALLLAMVIGGIFSYIMGLALFRLKGSYFAFASIGLTNLIFTVLQNWMDVTGGPDGISRIPKLNLYFFECKDYYDYFKVFLVIALICGLLVQRIRKSYFGRSLASVRDNEIAAQCLGVNVYRTKVLSFVVAGVLACLAGGLYAYQSGYISPDPFKFDRSSIYLIMVMLGGVDSTLGAFIGSLLLTILPEKMRFLNDYYMLIYGVGVIVLMVVMPMGIMGIVNILKQKIRNLFLKRKQGEVIEFSQDGEKEVAP